MNNRKRMIEAGLVALFLCVCSFGSTVFGQELISSTDQSKLRPPLSGEVGNTDPIFAFEKSSFKLTATVGNDVAEVNWYYKDAAGGMGDLLELDLTLTPVPTGSKSSELTVTGLKPGFYTFIAIGETSGDICSTEAEEFTVFVLRPFTVTLTNELASNTYCEDKLPTTANTLTAGVAYDASNEFNTDNPYTAANPAL